MKKILIVLFVISFLFPVSADAKWWIFGQSDDEVGFDYLYINGISFDDVDKELLLAQESLESGQVRVHGRAASGSSRVGKIDVSIDGGKTWNRSDMAKDGAFDYRFKAELDQPYHVLVKAIDTTGKSSDAQEFQVHLKVTAESMLEMLNQTLQAMKDAYEAENDREFMRYVSNDFEGDSVTLEMALRKDFLALDGIHINFTVTSAAFQNGQYYAAVQFNRNVFAVSDGNSYSDRGITEFSFVRGREGAMLKSMKNPLIFGLSYAGEIASGSTLSSYNNGNFLTVSNSGSVSTATISNLDKGIEDSKSGSFYLLVDCGPPCNTADGFNFIDDMKTTQISDSNVYKEINLLWGYGGVKIQELAETSIDCITVPETGYVDSGDISTAGKILAVKLPDNTYAVLKITSVGGGFQYFDYKYNPSGSRTF